MTQPRSENSAAVQSVAEKSSAAETAIVKSPMAESAVVKSPTENILKPSPVHKPAEPDPTQPKSVFVSDIHLGCQHSYAVEFLQFLNQIQPESLYLVGDIIDGRKLKKRWNWPDLYHRILCRVAELGKRGTRIVYTPGNHDSFVRDLMFHLPASFRLPEIEFVDECIHITESGQKLLVIHGDQFDHHEAACGIVSRCTAIVYDWLLWGNKKTTGGKPGESQSRNPVSHLFKSRFGKLQRFFREFQESASSYARSKGCDGVVCGHIHLPKIVQSGDFTYVNTGDWVEHCSALVESQQGVLKLVDFDSYNTIEPTLNPPDDSVNAQHLSIVNSNEQLKSVSGLQSGVRKDRFPQEVG